MLAFRRVAFSVVVILAAVGVSPSARAGSHSWAPWEFYSNGSGTVQFIELHNPTSTNEVGIATRFIRSLGTGNVSGVHGSNLPPNSTANKYLLAATADFAALPGAPAPDFPVLTDNFFDRTGDTIKFWNYTFAWSDFTFGPGDLPNGGDESLQRDDYDLTTATAGVATPTNFDGDTFLPPGVPDSGVQLIVAKNPLSVNGAILNVQWNDGACFGAPEFQIAYGFGSGLPAAPGGNYTLQAENPLMQCNITVSPKTWFNVPDPASDSSRLLWFLVLANDGVSVEGSWGTDDAGNQRRGFGGGGASAQCGSVNKSLINTCGH